MNDQTLVKVDGTGHSDGWIPLVDDHGNHDVEVFNFKLRRLREPLQRI